MSSTQSARVDAGHPGAPVDPGDRGETGEPTQDPSSVTSGSTLREGFAVLGVAIRREKWVFTLSTLGSVLFGALTVADAWVLGWATDNVVLPAFESGEVDWWGLVAILALFVGVAILRAVGIVGAPARCRHHAVPDAGLPPARRHPAVPQAAAGVAPAPPDRPAALQRQLRRGGGVGADRAAADGGRHRRDDGDRGRADAARPTW